MHKTMAVTLLAGCVILAGAKHAIAQRCSPNVAQVVALDECDPDTFNAKVKKGGLGEGGTGFCHNVALSPLGFTTTLSDLFAKAAAGTPDPNWDFEPDALTIQQGTMLDVVDQGGEPHTFTEVAQFGGGFVEGLNHGESTVPECSGGFSNVAVARTRILQGSHLDITGLSKGKHLFQCCIHPWMRMEVDVK
jgi:plastocyanin